MKTVVITLAVAVVIAGTFVALRVASALAADVQEPSREVPGTLYGMVARAIDGHPVNLDKYAGKVMLVVNTASKCGFTPQYEGLEKLYQELAPRGFVILAFPSNDFMNQEPGTPDEIRTFCDTTYHITFPLMWKDHVKGEKRSNVFRYLTQALDEPSWNFTKYLVDRQGHVVARFGPKTTPDDPELHQRIEAALDAD